MSGGAKAGVAIGVIAGIAIIALIVFKVARARRGRAQFSSVTAEGNTSVGDSETGGLVRSGSRLRDPVGLTVSSEDLDV